jgi:hypothetical protein
MKKIVKSLITTVGILGSTILFTGCVQLPPVPDSMKVSTYNNTAPVTKKSGYIDIRTLTEEQKLSCEYRYCITNSILDTNPNCIPSKNALDKILSPYKNDFGMERKMKAIDNFVKQCPHSNIIDSPFIN